MNKYQQGILIEEQIEDCKSANNIGGTIRFAGKVDRDRLRNALWQVIRRHPNLRCVLDSSDISYIDADKAVCGLTFSKFSDEASFEKHLHEVFNETGLLNRLGFFYIEACEVGDITYLIVRCHHLISDGFSMVTIARDMDRFWNDECTDEVSAVIDPDYGNGSYYVEHRDDPEFHTRSLQTVNAIYKAERKKVGFPKELQESLYKYVSEKKCNLFTLLLHSFSHTLLHFLEDDMIQIGIPVSVIRSKTDRPIGMFVNIVPFFAFKDEIDGGNGIENVSKRWFRAARNYKFPYGDIKAITGGEFEKYDYTFNFLPNAYPTEIGGIEVEFNNVHPTYQKYRLQGLIEVDARNDLAMILDYDINSFSDGFAEYFVEYFFEVLKATITGSDIKTIELESDKRLIETCLTKPSDALDTPFTMFLSEVRKAPDVIAVSDGDKTVTYGEFMGDVLAMVSKLSRYGVEKDKRVILDVEHSYQELSVIFALLYLGATFVPVNGKNWGSQRIDSILEQVEPCLCICDDPADYPGLKTVALSELKSQIVETVFTEEDYCKDVFAAYIIFTSGTTGIPKGVTVPDTALDNYLSWAKDAYEIKPGDIMPLFTTLTFDFTLTSVYLPLVSGAKIRVYPDTEAEHPLFRILEDKDISVIKITPSHMKMISLSRREYYCGLRLIIVGGENLTYENLKSFSDSVNGDFVCCNEYGPTEAAIGCVAYFTEPVEKSGNVPIGTPIVNTSVRIADKTGKTVPCFVKGELLISGNSLSSGYWKNEEKTSASFVLEDGVRWYKTGDIAWYNHKGYIEYGGRSDRQRKYHGYRVELGEISSIALRHETVREAVTLMLGEGDNAKIVLFYVPQTTDVDEKSLMFHMSDYLPQYIVVEFCEIDSIPLTLNGKVDERRLADEFQKNKKEGSVKDTSGISLDPDLVNSVTEALGIGKDFDPAKSFYELGGDSIKSFVCLSFLKEKGYDVSQNYFKLPISIADINGYLKKAEESAKAVRYDEPFEPTSVIRRFLENKEDISRIMQCIVLDIDAEFDPDAFLDAMYTAFPCFRLSAAESKLLYRANIQRPVTEEMTYADLKEVSFDLSDDGLMKLIRFTDIDKFGILIHHLAVDFVSWQIILECLDSFISEGKIRITETGSFVEYCERNKDKALFVEHSKGKVYTRCIDIADVSLADDLKDADKIFGIAGDVMVEKVTADLCREYFSIGDLFIEREGFGRDNGESGVGWFTDVSYERSDTKEIRPVKLRDTGGRLIRFNFIPLNSFKGFGSFEISEELSSFEWSCDLAYDSEFDVILSDSGLKLFITTADEGLAGVFETRFRDLMLERLGGLGRIDIEFEKDADIAIEDLLSILD